MVFQKNSYLSLLFSLCIGLLFVSFSGYSYTTSYETYENAILNDNILDDLLISVCVAGTDILPISIDNSIIEEACSTIDPAIRDSIASGALENVVGYITSNSDNIEYELETDSIKTAIIEIIPSQSLKSMISTFLPDTIPLNFIVSNGALDSIRSDISILSYVRFVALLFISIVSFSIYKYSDSIASTLSQGFVISFPIALIGIFIFSQIIRWDVNKIYFLSSTSIGNNMAYGYLTTYFPLTFLPLLGALICTYISRHQKIV